LDVPESNNPDAKTYKITFTHTGTTAMGAEMVRTYNIHMKEFFRHLGYYQPQPGLHVHPGHATNVGEDIVILRGFRTAANIHDEGKLLMNFEGSHKLVQRKNVLDIMQAIRNNAGSNFRQAIETALIGKLVVTNYNKRAYKIEGIDFDQSPNSTFASRDGTQVRFYDYFTNNHNCTIRDINQPLLNVIPNNNRRRGNEERDREIKLLPELCNIAGLTDPQRNDNRLKMDLIRASQVPPEIRIQQLNDFLKAFHSNAEVQSTLQTWGYNYGTEPLKLKGYIIPPTMIATSGCENQPFDRWNKANEQTADFQVRGGCVVTPCIQKMAFITARGEQAQKSRISNSLKMGFESIKLKVNNIEFYDLDGDNPKAYVDAIKRLRQPLTLALVVLRSQNKTIYDAVKKLACAEMGLVTQCVTARLMTDQNAGKVRSAATKIAIQVAAKVGGEPWWADIPLKKAMVCGYDTYHDTTSRGRSFGAFLASMNDRFSRWFSKADQHDKLDEMSSQVASNMLQALEAYRKLNGSLPERVIIYRDGVGEGQIEHVYKNELQSIREKITAAQGPNPAAKIRLTMIIVNKRIGARFYMRGADNRFMNPPPGTVIDHGPTRAERYDFYLISQSTRQGTVTPTYYNIIHDEAGFGPEIHQKMALKFCLLYYNWSGSVRVPAPCQYAHKLALLCGEHMHTQPNANLSDRLHFL